MEMADRAATTAVTYLAVLGMLTVLSAALFVTMGGFVDTQRERGAHADAQVIGNRLAADLDAVDRLARSAGPGGHASVFVDLPARAADERYAVTVASAGGDTYELTVTTDEVAVTVRVATETAVETGTFEGGALRLVYDGSGPIEVEHA